MKNNKERRNDKEIKIKCIFLTLVLVQVKSLNAHTDTLLEDFVKLPYLKTKFSFDSSPSKRDIAKQEFPYFVHNLLIHFNIKKIEFIKTSIVLKRTTQR